MHPVGSQTSPHKAPDRVTLCAMEYSNQHLQIVTADIILDRTAMVDEVSGKRQSGLNQPRGALAQGAGKAFNVIGFADLLRNRFVLLAWTHSPISRSAIGLECRLLAIYGGDPLPQLLGALGAAIFHVKGNHLASARIQRQPNPLLVTFVADKAQSFIDLDFQVLDNNPFRLRLTPLGVSRAVGPFLPL